MITGYEPTVVLSTVPPSHSITKLFVDADLCTSCTSTCVLDIECDRSHVME